MSELLPAFCAVWLVVAGVKLLSHTPYGFCQPQPLNTKSHQQKTLLLARNCPRLITIKAICRAYVDFMVQGVGTLN